MNGYLHLLNNFHFTAQNPKMLPGCTDCGFSYSPGSTEYHYTHYANSNCSHFVSLKFDQMLNNTAEKQSFMRLPKIGGRCPHTGLSRTTLTSILKSGNVRSHTVQLPGRSRGCRVIDVQSLLDYIGSCPNKPTKNNERRSYA